MTLKDFEQIIYIKSEIDLLSKRLHKEKTKGNELVGDYGKDYSTGQERVIMIHGFPITDTEKVNEILALIEKRKTKLENKVLEAERFIASIPDSKIRTILTLRFLEGKEWDDVARGIYKKMSGDAARKSIKKYFDDS